MRTRTHNDLPTFTWYFFRNVLKFGVIARKQLHPWCRVQQGSGVRVYQKLHWWCAEQVTAIKHCSVTWCTEPLPWAGRGRLPAAGNDLHHRAQLQQLSSHCHGSEHGKCWQLSFVSGHFLVHGSSMSVTEIKCDSIFEYHIKISASCSSEFWSECKSKLWKSICSTFSALYYFLVWALGINIET